jgi:hypothetical protein
MTGSLVVKKRHLLPGSFCNTRSFADSVGQILIWLFLFGSIKQIHDVYLKIVQFSQ